MWRTAFLMLATANLILVSYSATHADNAPQDTIVLTPPANNEPANSPITEPSSDFHEAIDNAVLDNKMEAQKTPITTPAPAQVPEASAAKPATEQTKTATIEPSKKSNAPIAAREPSSKSKKKKLGKKHHAVKHKRKKTRKH